MKIIIILLCIVTVTFIIIQLFAMSGQNNIESYPYEVVKKYIEFEIRDYEASLFTTVKLSGKQYKETSSKGFSVLAGYIFGGNERNEKISMTSPVSMSLEDSTEMMFMVPKKFDKASLPKPNQSEIEFKEVPAKTMAAISFGGWANDEKIDAYKNKLTAALDTVGISYINRFYFFGYNAPYEMFNRKNEVVVELQETSL